MAIHIPNKEKLEKQQYYGKLNFTGRWAYNREGVYPEGLITGILFLFAGWWTYNRGGGGLISAGGGGGGGAYKRDFTVFVQKAFLRGVFSGELIFGGAYYWREFGLGLTIKVASTNSPWAYLREGLLSEGFVRLRFGGLIFCGAYFFWGGGEGEAIAEILRYINSVDKILKLGHSNERYVASAVLCFGSLIIMLYNWGTFNGTTGMSAIFSNVLKSKQSHLHPWKPENNGLGLFKKSLRYWIEIIYGWRRWKRIATCKSWTN